MFSDVKLSEKSMPNAFFSSIVRVETCARNRPCFSNVEEICSQQQCPSIDQRKRLISYERDRSVETAGFFTRSG